MLALQGDCGALPETVCLGSWGVVRAPSNEAAEGTPDNGGRWPPAPTTSLSDKRDKLLLPLVPLLLL